jgi:L-ascorbate metabolism protein UlaG (beta-lactamase superfamily)
MAEPKGGSSAAAGTPSIRYVGEPNAVIDTGGLRLVTDPTFDPPGNHPIGTWVRRSPPGRQWTRR